MYCEKKFIGGAQSLRSNLNHLSLSAARDHYQTYVKLDRVLQYRFSLYLYRALNYNKDYIIIASQYDHKKSFKKGENSCIFV